MPTFKILVPGTILLDIYADTEEKFLGGAEFNFAYHLQHLLGGVDFIARVGDDEVGNYIIQELNQRSFPSHWIQKDPGKRSKTVLIIKNDQNEPSYIIPNDVASEFLDFPSLAVKDFSLYNLTYFGTTLQHGEKSRQTLYQILALVKGIKFCDLNLRPGKYTPETIGFSLMTCDFLKINHQELEVISDCFHLSPPAENQIQQIAEQFKIPGICLTLAEQGSLLYQQGQWHRKNLIPQNNIIDTVGAGDGFSACLAIGLLHGWPAVRLLDFASDFAAAICQIRGAVPRDDTFYDRFLTELRQGR